MLAASDTPEKVKISIRYQSLHDEHAKAVANLFSEQLNLVLDNPWLQISQINTVCNDDVRFMAQFNTAMPKCIDNCVHDLIKAVARERPASQAVAAWDGKLTYAELDDLSSQLARYLRQLGVCRETYVPICTEKSFWAVVSILAVFKAGGIFVPLDPSDPVARKRQIISRLEARILIASESSAKPFEELMDEVIMTGA